MTLRIVTQSTEPEVVIVLHGRLSSAEIEELDKITAERGRPSRLDLAQLTGVDADGLQALQRLRENGVHLTGISPYIALLLERAAGKDEGPQ